MRAHDFFNEDHFGTEPKRPARSGSRPMRGHDAEPRYKSAPVVPGGDNPDAPHKPNKGDEPVERGDQVVVQDPDNIATVFTGTVKRIGREHVYVALRNGETIAAPHDEVSKSYEVLSKRAHNILNKKGPSRSRYKVDEDEVLDEASYRDVIRELLDRFYKDVGLPPIQGNHLGILDIKSPGTRVWTRGDGVRHRDPGYIVPSYWSDEPKKGAIVVQKFWQWLQTQPGVRPLGQISGEFSTSKFSNMVGYKGLYFAGGQRGVEFGSASRFKNPRSVWRHTPPEQGVAETKKLTSREKLLRGLKRGGYDVEERSKFWDEKVKELERQRDEYEKELASRKQGVEEGWGDVAKLAALPVIAGAAAAGGQWLDNRTPKVDIGGKQVMVVNNPGWGTIPSNAMTLTGKDGKEYKVWKGSGKGTSQWLATPVENVKESMCAKHISPSGAETTMCPDDDDYEINYGKDSGIADFRKKQGLDVKTGKKVKEECAGVGIVTKQNSTADVGPGTIGKNLKAFNLESHDDDDYVQQLTNEFVRRAKLGRRYVPAETILGLLDHFFKKFAINDRYFDDVYHRAVRTTDHEAGILEMEASLEEWKASRQLCRSSTPDSELGASALASCKSQGLRARDGNKSHKLGKSPKSRMKMGGHRIKGKKYGGPIPDWS